MKDVVSGLSKLIWSRDFVEVCEDAMVKPIASSTTNQGVHVEGTHGSSHICSRGWPCWASVGEDALGPVMA